MIRKDKIMDTIISHQKKVKARKNHYCSWCNKIIEKGEEYKTSTYKSDDKIYTLKECMTCKYYVDKAFSDPFYGFRDDGMTQADFVSYMYEEHKNIAKEWW